MKEEEQHNGQGCIDVREEVIVLVKVRKNR